MLFMHDCNLIDDFPMTSQMMSHIFFSGFKLLNLYLIFMF